MKKEVAAPEGTATTNPNTPAANRDNNQSTSDWCRVSALRRRRAASWRSPALACGCSDPASARHDRHHPAPLTANGLDGYIDAAKHIIATTGLTPVVPPEVLRRMWARGGADRTLAEQIRADSR